MRKITLVLSLLFAITISTMAQISIGKEYRVKVETTDGAKYLDATDHSNLITGPNGGVCVENLNEESQNQIFIFETSGDGYKVKSKSGYYISCAQWNVNAYSTDASTGTVLYFTSVGISANNYLISNINGGSPKYFKCEFVNRRYDSDSYAYVGTNKYHPFCDAPRDNAATWILEEVIDEGTVEPEPEPEPEPTNPMDYYNTLTKPTFADGARTRNTSVIASVKFGTTLLTDYNYVKGTTSCLNQVVDVEAGKTYSLDLTYELAWGDLAMFQIDSKGTQKKIYGYYNCVWVPGGSPIEELKGSSEGFMCEELNVPSFDDLECVESGEYKYLTLPYKITIDEKLEPGDVVVVRAIVGKSRFGDNVAPQNVDEGGCLDIVFQIVEPEKPKLPVTLAQITDDDNLLYGLEGYITTFSAPYATTIPGDVTAYYAQEVGNSEVISLTELSGGVVPANFGVVLVGNAATATMEPTDVSTVTPNNAFSHSASGSVELGENCYVLANGQDGKGLYLAKTGLVLPANKAYLQLPASSQTSAFRFVVGETTAIQGVATEIANTSIYDLSGRRVFSTTKGGVYIQNGKKFIVK